MLITLKNMLSLLKFYRSVIAEMQFSDFKKHNVNFDNFLFDKSSLHVFRVFFTKPSEARHKAH